MNIEYAETARMSQTGSSLLRAIQNNSMPVLDLLVRESIQNSLDAADSKKSFVKVNFNKGYFDCKNLANNLEGISDKLVNRYQGMQTFIAISDSNTQGLSGPMNYDEVIDNDYGNLIKLVYEISKPQSKEGAGGSWGLGKTVYFRVGIGLVIYYSRIRMKNGKFQSRLAACLVEDEKKKDALLKRPDKNIERGIAWWGERKGIFGRSKETIPVTDEHKIDEILSVFGINAYAGQETGTTVIIPFISENKLLKEIVTLKEPINHNTCNPFWATSIENYLRLAVQKWYHPRIQNKNYKYGKYLDVTVNKEEISRENFYPYFRIMQDLYNSAVSQSAVMDSFPMLNAKIKPVNLRNVFSKGSHAGTLAHVEVDDELLKMLPPNNLPDPYSFLSLEKEDANSNPVIIGFTRKTGMIVSYEIMGPWADNTPKSEKGKYILAFFVLNSINTLKVGDNAQLLEEYIRQGELADHTSWGDWTLTTGNPNIVTKIQTHVRKELQNTYKNDVETKAIVEDRGMGREFAKFLLPPTGYGKGSSPKAGGGSGTTSAKARKNHLEIASKPEFRNGNIIFEFDLSIVKYRNPVDISFKAITEKMGLKADDWEKEDSVGSEFPLRIHSVEIDSLRIDNKEVQSSKHKGEYLSFSKSPLELKYIETEKYKQKYAIRLSLVDKVYHSSSVKIKGKLICKTVDPQLRVGVDLSEVMIDG